MGSSRQSPAGLRPAGLLRLNPVVGHRLMAWFADLSPYEYLPGRSRMLNVGWLDGLKDFPVGDVPPEFLEEIRLLARRPSNLCRGMHICNLCKPPEDCCPRDTDSLIRYAEWGKDRNGNGEIHVSSSDGQILSAPVLIVHYVEVHRYRPPREFVAAVLDLRGSRS